jgi:hypothetical protein
VNRPPPPPPARRFPAPPKPLVISQTFAKADRPTAFPPAEVPTPTKNLDIAIYQGLLSVFDEMSHEERLGFVELALLFKELSIPDRQRLVEEANRLRGRR